MAYLTVTPASIKQVRTTKVSGAPAQGTPPPTTGQLWPKRTNT